MRFPDDVPVLGDGDVRLRAHRLEDADGVVEQCTDPVSVRWTTVPLGYTTAMAVDWVTQAAREAWESKSEYLFAIESTHPDGKRRFSGSISLRDEGQRRAELAFGAHPAVRGHGVMTTAVGLVLDYGFSALGLETVIWMANVGNVASRRVAWKAGFTFGGTIRRWLPQRGEYLDGWVGDLHRLDSREPKTSWFDVPVIEGVRSRLRPLRYDDVPRVVEASADERSQYWLSFLPDPYTEQDAREFVDRCSTAAMSGGGLSWAVADAQTDVLLGTLGFPHGDRFSWEIGYLAHPDARGRGVMREAVGLATRHLFVSTEDGGMGASRAYIRAAADNTASQYVALANGFTQCGRERRSATLRDGTCTDLVLFDLLASEWQETRVGA
jgi:RimJ/RimL family protein N-acetyltransferase